MRNIRNRTRVQAVPVCLNDVPDMVASPSNNVNCNVLSAVADHYYKARITDILMWFLVELPLDVSVQS